MRKRVVNGIKEGLSVFVLLVIVAIILNFLKLDIKKLTNKIVINANFIFTLAKLDIFSLLTYIIQTIRQVFRFVKCSEAQH